MELQLTGIDIITADLVLVTGLRIGGGDNEMRIGGVDNQVIRHPLTLQPYIPGSSLKGKVRSLLEWRSGAVREEPLGFTHYERSSGMQQTQVKAILQLFGMSGDTELSKDLAQEFGPTRLSFWDCDLKQEWLNDISAENQIPLEVKSENSIRRISGTAENPRQTERVAAGSVFDFKLSIKRLNNDNENLLQTVLQGLKLLERDSLGGSGSRGYGKVRFDNLKINGKDISAEFDVMDPFDLKAVSN